jgi:hypothetical protein
LTPVDVASMMVPGNEQNVKNDVSGNDDDRHELKFRNAPTT